MARFTVDTDKTFDQTLAKLIEQGGGTKADVIQRAVATYQYLKSEVDGSGKQVAIRNPDGTVLRDVILP